MDNAQKSLENKHETHPRARAGQTGEGEMSGNGMDMVVNKWRMALVWTKSMRTWNGPVSQALRRSRLTSAS